MPKIKSTLTCRHDKNNMYEAKKFAIGELLKISKLKPLIINNNMQIHPFAKLFATVRQWRIRRKQANISDRLDLPNITPCQFAKNRLNSKQLSSFQADIVIFGSIRLTFVTYCYKIKI